MTPTQEAAMRQALEALESADWYINQLEQIVYSDDDTDTHEERAKVQAAITALRAALAEPVQEPVAWTNMPDADDWVFISGSADPNQRLAGKWHPLYTAPPQRKPLTETQIYAEIKGIDSLKAVEVARAIEKAHGIE